MPCPIERTVWSCSENTCTTLCVICLISWKCLRSKWIRNLQDRKIRRVYSQSMMLSWSSGVYLHLFGSGFSGEVPSLLGVQLLAQDLTIESIVTFLKTAGKNIWNTCIYIPIHIYIYNLHTHMKPLGWWCLGLCVSMILCWFSIHACYVCSVGAICMTLVALLSNTGKCETKNDKLFEGAGKRDFRKKNKNGFVSSWKDLGESVLVAII